MQSDHPVLHRHPVDKRLLVVDEVGVRDPELISDSVVERQVERDAGVGEALVSPRLLEVHGDGVVLRKRASAGAGRSLMLMTGTENFVVLLC